MRLLKRLRRNSEVFNKVKYTSISNLPIGIWDKIHNTKDVTLLEKKGDNKHNLELLLKTWEDINNEYLMEFGLPEEMEDNLAAEIRAAKLKARYIIEGKRHFITHAQIELEKVKFKVQNKGISLQDNLANLTKYYGVKMTELNTTVKEYYSYVKQATNGK